MDDYWFNAGLCCFSIMTLVFIGLSIWNLFRKDNKFRMDAW